MMDFCAALPSSPQRFLNDGEFLGDGINLENHTKADFHEFLHQLYSDAGPIHHSSVLQLSYQWQISVDSQLIFLLPFLSS